MKKIRMGIYGLNRGYDNIKSILLNDGEIIAVYDKTEELMARAKKALGEDVILCQSYDDLLNQDIDAVYLCNYFTDHAYAAVKALEKNISVISECIPNATMAEGVALVRAAEKSKGVYMLAENYPYMFFNQEMARVYATGHLGKVLFAEGEYNHPVAPSDEQFLARYYDSPKHWRNYLPATYYLTHSIGPLMMATHSNPIRVTAFPIYDPKQEDSATASQVADNAAIITTLNDDHSVYRITGCAHFGAHENTYRLACKKGQIENIRGTNRIRLLYNAWETPEGEERKQEYVPEETAENAQKSAMTGHDGGDFYMFRDFFDCLRTGRKPYLDVYVSTRMSSVGILAHRSLLENGKPYDIPDFSKEEDRKKYENDTLTPFWDEYGNAPTLPCSSDPNYHPTKEMVDRFNKIVSNRDFKW